MFIETILGENDEARAVLTSRFCLPELPTELADVIAGTFLICDCSGSDFGSLSKEQAERYRKQFQYPERFYRENGAIKAVPYNPEKETER